jgi:hypothetical protein
MGVSGLNPFWLGDDRIRSKFMACIHLHAPILDLTGPAGKADAPAAFHVLVSPR